VTTKKKPSRQSARSNSDQKIIAALLATVRSECDVTQTELADRLGKPQSWVGKAERASRRVDVLELMAICEALRVDTAKFLQRLRRQLKKDRD
jgi:transcriptional regulator with XRE-family HTH domain